MRIDLNAFFANQISTEKSSKSATNATSTRSGALAQDKATLSTDTVGLSGLEAKVAQMPEVRQDKVDALRSAVQSGTYKVQPNKIAEAMLSKAK